MQIRTGLVWLASCLAALATQVTCAAPPAGAAIEEEVVRQATFVFIGTVEKKRASTMDEVRATASTAIVRVDRILEPAQVPADLAGSRITLQLADADSIQQGAAATFYTRGWLVGDSIAVIEIAHRDYSGEADLADAQVKATRQKIADEALAGEIRSAESVVMGRVIQVKPAGIPELPTEHTPNWLRAQIAVESVLKGPSTRKTVSLLFPGSPDPAWGGAPKFQEGQEGIWLLHRGQVVLPGLDNEFTALKALDFQSGRERERVRGLAAKPE